MTEFNLSKKLKEFLGLTEKGEFIKFCEKHHNGIKKIDTAIPVETFRALFELNVEQRNFVTIYYKNGNVAITDIVAKASEISRY